MFLLKFVFIYNLSSFYIFLKYFKPFINRLIEANGFICSNNYTNQLYTLNKYKNYIIEGLSDKIDTIKKGKKPKVNPEKAIIYIFKTADTPENSLYKIHFYYRGKSPNSLQ